MKYSPSSSKKATSQNYSQNPTSNQTIDDQSVNLQTSSQSGQQQSTSDLDTSGSQDDPTDGNYPKSPHQLKIFSKHISTETTETIQGIITAEESNISSNDDDETNLNKTNRKQTSHQTPKFIEKFNQDYDGQIEEIADRATDLIAKGSFFNCGLYQFVSFVFVSIAWTVGNGWYAYVSVFTGYTPEHECDYAAMGNFIQNSNDTKCSAIDMITNQSVKCTKWKYDQTQMLTTIITEYDFVCDKNYFFELAYSLEQIGYIVGTLIFSFVADIIGRKPVLLSVLISMSVCGLLQYFINNFILFMVIGFIINSLACGLEAVCVTLVLEMFSTSKRTLFGIGIEVIWVIVLASMAPLAYLVKMWREIRLIIFVVLAFLAIFSHFFVQESIRWLISMSNIKKVNQIVDKISRYNRLNKRNKKFDAKKEQFNQMLNELEIFNKLHLDTGHANEALAKTPSVSDAPSSEAIEDSNNLKTTPTESTLSKRANNTALDILKNPKFRIYVLIMSLNWFATALVYDGLTYLNNYIGENIFFNWIVMNLIELPAQFACYYVISRYGRRLTVSITLILAGVTLLATFIEVFDAVEKLAWVKLFLFIFAKFIVTQSYSAVILHAPELFPTNLRSFGYGICLFSGKITSVISPMISIYLSKIIPLLPALIYGAMSICCGIISLYVPETLNRPLPNSIEDVVKWPRNLTKEEWKVVKELNKIELDIFRVCKKKKKGNIRNEKSSNTTSAEVLRMKKSSLTGSNKINDETLAVHESNTLPSLVSASEKIQFGSSTNSSSLSSNLNSKKEPSVQLSTTFSSSSEPDDEDKKENFNEAYINSVIVI